MIFDDIEMSWKPFGLTMTYEDFDDMEMSWKPFGLTMTYEDFDDLLSWYIDNMLVEQLNTMEDNTNAIKLRP